MSTPDERYVDRELMLEFIDESLDQLAPLPSLFVSLERRPDDVEKINAIFRPVHSIKGNSSYFGLFRTKTLAHEMESILDLLRKQVKAPDAPTVNVLLRGLDQLVAMLENAREDRPESADEAGFEALVAAVRALAVNGPADDAARWRRCRDLLTAMAADADGDSRRLPDRIAELRDLLDQLGPVAEPPPKSAPDAAAGSLPAALVEALSLLDDAGEEALDDARADRLDELLATLAAGAEGPAAQAVADARDSFDTLRPVSGIDEIGLALIGDCLRPLADPALWPPPSGTGAANAKAPTAAHAGESHKTMRVAEERIDGFLAYVGDLITIGETYENLHKRLENGADERFATDLRHTTEAFNELSAQLRQSIMAIRLVPMRTLLQKVPRLVRDIAAAGGKEIAVTVSGDTVELDKSLLDSLEAPLVHLVRNAADHGIETPAQRRAAGKEPRGTVSVAASERDGRVVIRITDDGKGLDLEAIRAKALRLGRIAPQQVLGPEALAELVFLPGLSTATEVTEVSGRGVGMDVVKRNIEAVGGRISLRSQAGQGTEISLTMPRSVSTRIIHGAVVRLRGSDYVLPVESIIEFTAPRAGDFCEVVGRGRCVRLRDRLLPLVEMTRLFGLGDQRQPPPVLVLLEERKQLYALGVDEIVGLRQMVLKDVDGIAGAGAFFAGGAIMGDGRVAMVLDPRRLRPHEPTSASIPA